MSNTKLSQYTHRPNMTELGMGNTHETYMLISADTNLSHIFPPSTEVKVRDIISGKRYALKSANGREFRVNQMGDLYRDYNVLPGDEIVITKIEKEDASDICVNVRKFSRVVLMVGSNGVEIVNIDRLNKYLVGNRKYNVSISDRGNTNQLTISFRESRKKRQDSPNTTDYYNVTINGVKLANGTYYLTLGDPLSSLAMLSKSEYNEVYFDEGVLEKLTPNINPVTSSDILPAYRPYITAIKSKPFLLLAGISGTGKSRIVRELARACWDEGSPEFKAQKPKNFEMVQVKPNWHDSSELIGYVSRIDGVRYVVGPFLKFMVKAINAPDIPYFLCLDEMNLAPVEQYFAEYLSVVESRKRQEDGTITTDPIVDYSNTDEYKSLIDQLFPNDDTLRSQYLTEKGGKRLSIPTNLIVVGTVNMDETTFSFSRKVLDRAMTIEMNKVNLKGGLDCRHEKIGKLGKDDLVGEAVEGVDVYDKYEDVCNTAIAYLEKINEKLEGTPFKIAYRTRNEVLLYVVNNLPYNKIEGDDESTYKTEFVVARALDEITNMKVLSRIEGDETKVTATFLKELGDTIHDGLEAVFAELFDEDDDDVYTSVSLAKLEEMKERLKSGYTSFWS